MTVTLGRHGSAGALSTQWDGFLVYGGFEWGPNHSEVPELRGRLSLCGCLGLLAARAPRGWFLVITE